MVKVETMGKQGKYYSWEEHETLVGEACLQIPP